MGCAPARVASLLLEKGQLRHTIVSSQWTLSLEEENSLPNTLNHVKAHSGDTNPQGRLWRAETEMRGVVAQSYQSSRSCIRRRTVG